MNDNTQQINNNPLLLQSLVMIFLETVFTFILKHDRVAREHAKVFIRLHTTIHLQTFLPSQDFYIRFDPKGLLFDLKAPEQLTQSNIIISASSIDLMRFLLTGHQASLNRIRLKGDDSLHTDFKLFLNSIAMPSLFSDWKNWLSTTEKTIPNTSIQPLMQRIDAQRTEINKLNLRVKECEYDLKVLQHKHKTFSRVYWLIIILLIVAITILLCYNLL